MNFQSWLREASNKLCNSESPNRDAEILLEYVTGKSRAFLLAFGETPLTFEQKLHLSSLLIRRSIGEPMAYLIGEREFWSLPLYVSSATLIPRPETECLVEQALIHLPNQPCRILDLGTGTGAIALALATERPDCIITAVDFIIDAIALTCRNINRLKISNIKVLRSFWFDALFGKKFEMIVSNPPYISALDPHLLQGDVRFEPLIALVAADEGMACLNHIIFNAHKYLSRNGWLLVEHGWKQSKFVRTCFILAGYKDVRTFRDYGNNERITLGNLNKYYYYL